MTSAAAAEASAVSSRLPSRIRPLPLGPVVRRDRPCHRTMLTESGWHVALVDINADGVAGVEKELREGP